MKTSKLKYEMEGMSVLRCLDDLFYYLTAETSFFSLESDRYRKC